MLTMSCGHIALDKLGANVERYYATEIDKYAIKTTMENYPNTIQLGDAFQVRETGWGKPGLFTDYDGFYANLLAHYRLGQYEDILFDADGKELVTVEHLTELVKAEQKRREGCQRCWNGECMMSGVDYSCETTCDKCRYSLRDKHFCPDCGRDLKGEQK